MPKHNKKKQKRRKPVRNNSVDFFGMKKAPSYLKSNSNISFLNSKRNVQKPNKVKPLFNNYKTGSNKLGLNWKQAKRRFPGLNPWGDADLDGSPNRYDCKPFDASKDGELFDAVKGVFKRKKKEFRVESKQEKILRETTAKIRGRRRDILIKRVKAIRKVIKVPSPKKFKKFRAGVESLISEAGIARIPRKTKSTKGQGVQAGAGRPRGSFKFSIPGRGPVPIHVYKKWITQQKALIRIKALAQVKATQTAQAQQPLEGEEEFVDESQMPQELQQIQPPMQAQPVQQPTQISQAQQQFQQPIQQQGVPKENLDFSRGGVLTPQGGNILNAPNIIRGELKNVGEVPIVRLSEKPQANPRGEVYTNIDPVTGNPIFQRRITEKFMTGEAL